jgi:hypothetical protein
MTDIKEHTTDHLVVYHPDGRVEKKIVEAEPGTILRVGRELDNDIVLIDPRTSRHHAEIRRSERGLEVRDVGSANGTLIGTERLTAEVWHPLGAGQTVHLADTRLFWQRPAASRATMGMTPVTAVSVQQAPTERSRPWIAPVVVSLLVVAGLVAVGVSLLSGRPAVGPDGQPSSPGVTPPPGLAGQTPSGEDGATAADTPTPAGPLVPIPGVTVEKVEVAPILAGPLPDLSRAWLRVQVRVENLGNAPFFVSTRQFSLQTAAGDTISEAGAGLSEQGLRRLGLLDRFEDLRLVPGGSVPESLIFALDATPYELSLRFTPDALAPVVLDLGQIDAGRELALALGTPVAGQTEVAVARAASPTATEIEPTLTPTRPAITPPRIVPASSLRGTIAYPVFNGTTYDLYFGDVASGESRLYRNEASQPAFSVDGTRIAFHSWAGSSRGLITASSSGGNEFLITNFLEDQLPTWSEDGGSILFLSRRTGGRQSQLYRTRANVEFLNNDAQFLTEGEYPSSGPGGPVIFKGWGTTAFGLRSASDDFSKVNAVTLVEDDTAPALSPDGGQVVFMGRREGHWDIYVVNIDGSGLQRLTTDPADDGLPSWSPDGRAIAFVSNRGGPWSLWATPPQGTGTRQLITIPGSPDGFVNSDSSSFETRGWAEERISWTR